MERVWLSQYQSGVPREIDANQISSLVALLENTCQTYPKRAAFWHWGQQWSFAEFERQARHFAAYLHSVLKLKKGTRIAIMLPNIVQFPIALFGAWRAGLVVVPINPQLTPHELTYELRDAAPEAILVLANCAHTLASVLTEVTVPHVIVTEVADAFGWFKRRLINAYVRHIKRAIPAYQLPQAKSWSEVCEQGKKAEFIPVQVLGGDVALLQYTGGTTGRSKGAMLTHRNLIANIEQIRAWLSPIVREQQQEVIITALPLYHSFCLTVNGLALLSLGGLNVLITDPRDLNSLIATMKKVPFTLMTGVNTLFNALLHQPRLQKLKFRHLRLAIAGGMPLQQGVAERWLAVTRTPILEGYGLTEASPVVSCNPLHLRQYNGTVGVPLPSTDISIRDDQGQECATGTPGSLWVKGPQVMQAYWQHPEETEAVLQDRWLDTGDIAQLDAKGFIQIIDRKKDLILVSGFNVYPNEVEEAIALHPGVLEVAVIGIPNEEGGGEIVKAFVVKRDPTLEAKAIQAHCQAYLTAYKIPRIIEFRDSLPKNLVGKMLRRELRADDLRRG